MSVVILVGDVLERLKAMPDKSVHCVICSPPYWAMRDYGVVGQIGLEPTWEEHIAVLIEVFEEVKRVLRDDGTLWVNYGDAYASTPNGRAAEDIENDDRCFRDKPVSNVQGVFKAKDKLLMPARFAIAMQEAGWWVRSDIIWHKPNPMPESVTDRPISSHEHLFLFTKSPRYFYDHVAVREPASWDPSKTKEPDGWDTGPGSHGSIHKRGRDKGKPSNASGTFKRDNSKRGIAQIGQSCGTHREEREKVNYNTGTRNLRDVWTVATKAFSEAHFATFPPDLIKPCIQAGTSEMGVCPACGAPYVRETSKKLVKTPKAVNAPVLDDRDSLIAEDQGSNRQRDGHINGMANEITTNGWKKSCKCKHASIARAVVLDPFGGAGTTGLVADQLQRSAILIELNPEYAELARERIEADAKLFSHVRLEAAE